VLNPGRFRIGRVEGDAGLSFAMLQCRAEIMPPGTPAAAPRSQRMIGVCLSQ
jgi:hypothetical protein